MKSLFVLLHLLLLIMIPAALAFPPLPQTTPNGILVDRVVPLAHLEDLDGSATAAAGDLARWRQTVHELRRAAEENLGWPAPRHLQNVTLAGASPHRVPLALVHATYDRMTESGQTAAAEVFALAVLREELFHGAATEFILEPADFLTHRTAGLASMTLDPDDGGGPRELTFSVPFPVSYSTTGVKHPVLKATLIDGRTLTATTALNVKRLVTPTPHETWAVTASEAFADSAATGLAYVYLAPGRTALTNPAIVVEGFDLDNTMDWPVLYDLLNQENMLEDLRSDGYDAVVLDFTEATEPIQRNAFVLTELLGQVQAAIAPGRTVAVVGASMGGLVSRYALAWLEQQGTGHQVRTFISFDAPHGGANIPLGLQHWLDFFQGESEDAAFLLSRLNTPAARQMLLYHHLSTAGTVAGADPLFAAFQADLAGVGDWPAAPRLVGVANGSGAGLDQGFTAGDQLIFYEYRSLLADIDGNVWAVPDGGTQVIFDGMINLIWPLPDTYLTVTVGGTLPWDSAPGGYRASMAQMDTTAVPYGDIVALHDNHCFIPTISALALVGVGPFFDIAGDPALLDKTAFDQVYFPAANQEHIAITPENKVWFIDEIEAGVSAVEGLPVLAAGGPVLHPAAPNPFNPRTGLRFTLPESGRVSLRIHDLAGRLVRTLLEDRYLGAGPHREFWNGRDNEGGAVAAGVYFSRLQVDDEFRTGRLTLVK
ncbi:MAG: hypothetical protein ABFS42_13250 [Candidatus Krumholzibacteriota bacterium]